MQLLRSLHSTVMTMILTQLLHLLFLLHLQFKSTESVNAIALPGCQESCEGNDIPIPYPFGIGPNCFLSQEFNVACEIINNGVPTPYLVTNSLRILNISLSSGQARTSSHIFSQCYNSTTKEVEYNDILGSQLSGTPFWLNTEKNKFTVIGCNTLGYFRLDENNNYSVGCLSSCDNLDTLTKYGSCSGIGCCQTAIFKETKSIMAIFDKRYNNSEVYNFSPCSYAMVVEEDEFKFDTTYITTNWLSPAQFPLFYSQPLPMVVDWAIGNTTCDIAHINKSSFACTSDHSVCLNSSSAGGGYLCKCSHGYEGNPYLDGGCQDIDECATQNPCSKAVKCHNFEGGYRCFCPFGFQSDHINNLGECDRNMELVIGIAAGIGALLFFGVGIYVVLERRNLSKVKKKYFQQHGGWILLEEIKSNQGFGFTIFTKQQLEQATNSFHSAKIIGHGGQGTVYKGTLRDQTIAIKKCKIADESKKKEYGKEILILSQINHKNIVKILGCCLEVEVPMLVYEFIPNGTLYQCIHYKKQGSHISLATRLRIAHESAEALAYLHTSASPPIFHGDVKSANILLDHDDTAKVSDFGASVLAPTDEAQFVTFVQGTYGYLDPEYLQSGHLTDKSDVYSFGVVLLELLTSKPVIDFDVLEERRSLSSRFLSAMKENKMQELLDGEIKHEDDMELIRAVAKLAEKCLSMKGEERPMMKEVAIKLHRIYMLKQHSWGQEYNLEETKTLLNERSHHEIEMEYTEYYFNIDKEAEESIVFGR